MRKTTQQAGYSCSMQKPARRDSSDSKSEAIRKSGRNDHFGSNIKIGKNIRKTTRNKNIRKTAHSDTFGK